MCTLIKLKAIENIISYYLNEKIIKRIRKALSSIEDSGLKFKCHLPNSLDTAIIAMNKTHQSNDVSSGKYIDVVKYTQKYKLTLK